MPILEETKIAMKRTEYCLRLRKVILMRHDIPVSISRYITSQFGLTDAIQSFTSRSAPAVRSPLTILSGWSYFGRFDVLGTIELSSKSISSGRIHPQKFRGA